MVPLEISTPNDTNTLSGSRLADRVLLLGWDGAEPVTLRTLLLNGRLPVLQSLLERGSCLELATPRPVFARSAWTSLATGKHPHEHGVLHDLCINVYGDQLQPITRHNRTTSALWNILHRAGLQTHIVGWPVSHPAESLTGIFVSDRFASPESTPLLTQQDGPTVLPREAFSHLDDRRVSQSEAEEIALSQLLPAQLIGLREYSRVEAACRDILAQSATLFRTIRWCLDVQPWNFSACVFPGFHRSHELAHSLERLSPTGPELSKHLISGCYEHHDLLLGQILSQVDDSTYILVISPTGPQAATSSVLGAHNNHATFGSMNRNAGLAVFKGPNVLRLTRTMSRNLLDIAPTILTMFGLPYGEDMGGRPMLECFESGLTPSSVETWDIQSTNTTPQSNEWKEDREDNPKEEVYHLAVEYLIELGYVDPLDIAAQNSVNLCRRTTELNRAISLLDAGQIDKSIDVINDLKEDHYDSHRAHFLLAEALFRARRFEASLQEIDLLMCRGFENPQLYYLAAANEFADRRYDRALDELACTQRGISRFPGAMLLAGNVHLRKRDFSAAQEAFEQSIVSDGPTASALDGLAAVKIHLGKPEEAAMHALDAIDQSSTLDRAHYHLAIALILLNKPNEAIGALRNWASLDSMAAAPYRWMARVHQLQLADPVRANACRLLGKEVIRRRRTSLANQRAAST